MGAGSGVRGVPFNYVIGQDEVKVELYIDRGKDQKEANERIFDQLQSQKNEIERELDNFAELFNENELTPTQWRDWLKDKLFLAETRGCEKGKSEVKIEHCGEINCGACNVAAYSAGQAEMLEKVMAVLPKEKVFVPFSKDSVVAGINGLVQIKMDGFNDCLSLLRTSLLALKKKE